MPMRLYVLFSRRPQLRCPTYCCTVFLRPSVVHVQVDWTGENELGVYFFHDANETIPDNRKIQPKVVHTPNQTPCLPCEVVVSLLRRLIEA